MTKPSIMQLEQAQRVAEHFDMTLDEALNLPGVILAVFDRRAVLYGKRTPTTQPQPKEEYESQILDW